MKQSLKIGFMTVVVAAMAAGGMALAQSDGGDDAVPPGDAPVENVAPEGFGGRGGHRGMRGGPGHLDRVADILGVDDPQVIVDQLEAGATLAEIAADYGFTAESLVDELVADLEEKLSDAVANERIDQDGADEILAGATEKITTRVNSTREEIQAAREANMAERRAGREARRAERRETISAVIGIPFGDIQAALEADDTTLADIAGEQGVDLDTLVAGLIAPAAADLADKVADGTLTQEEADERLATITERVTEMAQAVPGDGHAGRRGPGHGGPRFSGGGFGPPSVVNAAVSLSA